MNKKDVLNQIYFDYRKELLMHGLKEFKATDMFNTIKKAQRPTTIITTTVNFFNSLSEEIIHKNKGKTDWLKQNPCLNNACKINGIKTSKELRELIYQFWEEYDGNRS